MAWVNGEWVNRQQRAERIRLIQERASKLKSLYDSGNASPYHVDMLLKDKEELKQLKRIHRSEVDMLYFFYEYFSECRNPGNPDNLVPTSNVDMMDAPEFHQKLSRILDSVSNVNTTARICWAASRGHAKSAYLSNAFPAHEICFQKRKMILIISETNAGSKKFIKWVADQLKYNQKLRDDYGILLHEQKSKNEKDSEEAFVTTTGIKMEATSLGMQIRGFRNGNQRPDLILLDDLESRDSNNTPELRQKNKDWLNQDLMPAYDPTRTAVIFMGTLVHPESLLNYVLKNRRDFIKNKFPAIVEHPVRSDLWSEFERIYKEYEPTEEELLEMEISTEAMETPNARAAMAFYEANKEEMDKGVRVLWPDRFPIYKLIIEKVNFGRKAFNTEYMNNPLDEESQIFVPERFYYWTDKYPDLRFSHEEYQINLGIDFAMGKKRGDFSSIVALAKNKLTRKRFVADTFIERVHPNVFMNEILKMVLKWQPDGVAAEAQMAQEFFVDQLKDKLQEAGYPAHTRVHQIHQRTRKEIRIEAMLPDVEKGDIQFSRNHYTLLEMFERYGSNYHDDGPDALEMADSLFKTSDPLGFSLGVDLESFFEDQADHDWLHDTEGIQTLFKIT
jgi:predicted phage terminase large subunit-like protein